MSLGAALAAKRGERGLSIEQVAAATQIRPEHLQALESDELGRFPAAVYAKGYLRTYARFLELDPEQFVEALDRQALPQRLALGLGRDGRRPGLVLTAPVLGALVVVMLIVAFAVYTWRQLSVDERTQMNPVAAASPAVTSPSASPSVRPRTIVVAVRVTETAWINVVVDGAPQYGDSGRTLPPGSVVYFTGADVKISSGKAAATFITVDGRDVGPLGAGVATRDFTSQTAQ